MRAYWIGQATRLFLELGNLSAPVLGWQEWDALSDATKRQLEPLAQEAEKRFVTPLLRATARLQPSSKSGDNAQITESQSDSDHFPIWKSKRKGLVP